MADTVINIAGQAAIVPPGAILIVTVPLADQDFIPELGEYLAQVVGEGRVHIICGDITLTTVLPGEPPHPNLSNTSTQPG